MLAPFALRSSHDFDSTPKGVDFDAMMASFKHMGFQATNLGLAIDEVNKMVRFNLCRVGGNEEIRPAGSSSSLQCPILSTLPRQ